MTRNPTIVSVSLIMASDWFLEILALISVITASIALPTPYPFKFLHKGCDSKLDFKGQTVTTCKGPIPKLDLTLYNSSTVLILSDLNLLSLSPATFSNFTNLKELHIHRSLLWDPFTPVAPSPTWLGYVAYKNLTVLDLSHNRLATIPTTGFKYLTKVTSLNLTGNALTSVPAGLTASLTSLETLDVSDNPIESIPCGSLSGATSLTTMSLRKIRVQTLLGCEFTGMTSLTTLDMSDGQLTSVAPGTFIAMSSLTDLSLRSNKLKTFAYDGTPPTEGKKKKKQEKGKGPLKPPSLATLDLEDNLLEDIGPFTSLVSLRTLKLNRNAFKTLKPSMFQGLVFLEELYIQSCPSLLTIEPSTFTSLSNLVMLDVEGNLHLQSIGSPQFGADQAALEIILLAKNDLMTLHLETFSVLPNLALLRIRDNSLRCDCEAKWIREEFESPKYIWSQNWAEQWPKQGGPTCRWPPGAVGMPLAHVPTSNMTCPPTESPAEVSPPRLIPDVPKPAEPKTTSFVIPEIPKGIFRLQSKKGETVFSSTTQPGSSLYRQIAVGMAAFVGVSMTTWFIVFRVKQTRQVQQSQKAAPPTAKRRLTLPFLNRGYQYVYSTFE